MNIFGTMLGKIFGHGKTPAAPGVPSATTPQADRAAMNQPVLTTVDTSTSNVVDVEAVLNDMASKSGQKLNWRTSIVDLMKLLGMESSLAERRELADELGFTGDKSDTATMNMWLHKQVMQKVAENGGTVPADLLD